MVLLVLHRLFHLDKEKDNHIDLTGCCNQFKDIYIYALHKFHTKSNHLCYMDGIRGGGHYAGDHIHQEEFPIYDTEYACIVL